MERIILLPGEGSNRHVLYGVTDLRLDGPFNAFDMRKDGFLRHEDPGGALAEHRTLAVEKGMWVTGRQLEYDPFDGPRGLTPVWD